MYLIFLLLAPGKIIRNRPLVFSLSVKKWNKKSIEPSSGAEKTKANMDKLKSKLKMKLQYVFQQSINIITIEFMNLKNLGF